jgi:hypothetical protein
MLEIRLKYISYTLNGLMRYIMRPTDAVQCVLEISVVLKYVTFM